MGEDVPAAVLDVRGLSVAFETREGPVRAVEDVSFTVSPGETLALVGESGSGKSVTSLAILRLTPPAPRTRLGGKVLLRDRQGHTHDLLGLPEAAMQAIRGNEIAMVFQEPMTSLNPVQRIGEQIAEAVTTHRAVGRREALDRACHLLARVGIPDARRRLAAYPHHLSGGMRQRVMIAMALACDPSVLIADEPTTALDVTVQAQILDLLKELQAESGMAILFITHNLGVVAEVADRVMVMYAGRIVECGGVMPVMTRPLMPYTRGLLRSVPSLDIPDVFEPLPSIRGTVPSPLALPPGCAFGPRCDFFRPGMCDAAIPPLVAAVADPGDGAGHLRSASAATAHEVRCLRWRETAETSAPP